MHHAITTDVQSCIDECLRCHTVCLADAINHCLQMGGAHAAPDHIRIMLDCAQICATAADFMARGSAYHAQVCRVCAEICAACAASCEAVGSMDDCVAACRACEAGCRRMADMAH